MQTNKLANKQGEGLRGREKDKQTELSMEPEAGLDPTTLRS